MAVPRDLQRPTGIREIAADDLEPEDAAAGPAAPDPAPLPQRDDDPPEPGMIETAVRTINRDVIPFKLGQRMVSAGRAISGSLGITPDVTYDDAMAQEEGRAVEAQAANPITAGATKIGGTIGTILATGGTSAGMSVAQAALRTGVGTGIASTGGADVDFKTGRGLPEAANRAAVATALGAIGGAGMQAASMAGKSAAPIIGAATGVAGEAASGAPMAADAETATRLAKAAVMGGFGGVAAKSAAGAPKRVDDSAWDALTKDGKAVNSTLLKAGGRVDLRTGELPKLENIKTQLNAMPEVAKAARAGDDVGAGIALEKTLEPVNADSARIYEIAAGVVGNVPAKNATKPLMELFEKLQRGNAAERRLAPQVFEEAQSIFEKAKVTSNAKKPTLDLPGLRSEITGYQNLANQGSKLSGRGQLTPQQEIAHTIAATLKDVLHAQVAKAAKADPKAGISLERLQENNKMVSAGMELGHIIAEKIRREQTNAPSGKSLMGQVRQSIDDFAQRKTATGFQVANKVIAKGVKTAGGAKNVERAGAVSAGVPFFSDPADNEDEPQ